jgi:hypothetical protein
LFLAWNARKATFSALMQLNNYYPGFPHAREIFIYLQATANTTDGGADSSSWLTALTR